MACVVLCVFFSLAILCRGQGRPDLNLGQSDSLSDQPSDTLCALPLCDFQPLLAGLLHHSHAAGPALLPEDGADPALLAAVPGGLCLLI